MDIQKAKQAIDACDVISFDIFDTLVLRLCARAEDIFRIMEHTEGIRGFAAARVEMQKKCSIMVEKTRREPHCTFADIYEYMQKHCRLDLNGRTFGQLKQKELDTETLMLVKNASVYELFSYAKKSGKRVIAVSDMYLGKREILPIIEGCGYTGLDAVYISADVKKTKYRFDMFEYVVEHEGVAADRILHIGDNKKDDFENAKSCGLRAFLYDGARDKRKMPLFNSVCAGVSCMLKNRDGGFWYGLGADVGGALYCGLIPMLLDRINAIKPEKLFFLSRDGYNMHQIFKRLRLTDIPMEYFYASRRALLLCGMDGLDAAGKRLLPPFTFEQSVRDILSYLDMADMDEKFVRQAGFSGFDDIIKNLSDFDKFRNIFEYCPDYFNKKISAEKEGFKNYLEKTGYNGGGLVFDAGWNGSSQFLLDRALGLAGYAESSFVYAGLMNTKKCRRQLSGKEYSALLFGTDKNRALCRRLGRSIVLAELFFGAPHAAVWKYDKNDVLYENDESDLSYKKEILRGISDVAEIALPLLERLDIRGSAAECLAPVYRLIEHPTVEEAVKIGDIENADGFVARLGEKKYIARLDISDIKPELNEFYWPEGIYTRPDMDMRVKEFVMKKTGVKMKAAKRPGAAKRPNVFARVKGYIDSCGVVTTAFLIKKKLTAVKGDRAYNMYIEAERADIKNTEPLEYRPLFSFVIPVYNTAEKILRECIESVLAQTYDNYELILVDDKSTVADVPRVLDSYMQNKKIKTIYRSENGHISRCTNTGIEAARGEYIIFADCDDIVAPNAVYEFTKAVNADKTLDFIYSDEDKTDGSKRFDPHFKPDWSPDTLMSLMYTGHLAAYRTSIVRDIGGLRSEFDGAQDYDLTLRFTEKTRHIAHIPKILYHWRVSEGSIASDMNAKPYVYRAVEALKKQALERRGLDGRVVFVPKVSQYRVVYTPKNKPLVSIIIPSKDNFAVFERCLNSILQKTEYNNYEIIVVDNGSTDENAQKYASVCAAADAVYARKEEKFNFSRMCNKGAALSKGEYLLFLNDDTQVINGDWLEIMVGQASLEHAGAVGAKLLYPNSTVIQHCGVINLRIGPGHALTPLDDSKLHYFCRNSLDYNYIAVTAACLCVSRQKFDHVKGFDENFAVAYNDVELCFKLYEAGWYNCVRTDAVLYHYESVSRGHDEQSAEKTRRLMREMAALYKKHPRLEARDPFYNPNLAGNKIDFSVGVDAHMRGSRITARNIDVKPYLSKRVKGACDMVHYGAVIYVSGWAYVENAALNSLNICRLLLVDGNGRATALAADKMIRFDISAANGKNSDLNLSGFECGINAENMEKGVYKAGVMLINGGKKYVRIFDDEVCIK